MARVRQGDGSRRGFRDPRMWALILSFPVIAVLDALVPHMGFLTFVIIPVVASIALGRTSWTVGLAAVGVVVFLGLSQLDPAEPVVFWRRLVLVVAVCILSVLAAGYVARVNARLLDECRKADELANRLSEARDDAEVKADQIQAMIDSLLDPYILFTPVVDESGKAVDLRFAEANEAAFAYNRSSPEEMLGHTFLEFFPGLMEHGPMALYLRCANTGEPVNLEDYEYPNEILQDDRRYDIRAARTARGMVLTWRDVTERHRSVQALADSERRYRLLAENATDVIWQVGPDGRVEWASDSTHAVLGWPADHVIGRVALDFIHPDERDSAMQARGRVLQGVQIRDEFRVECADGRYRWMAFNVRGVPGPEGVTRIVSLRDIDAEVVARQELAGVVGRDPLTGLLSRERMQERIADTVHEVGSDAVAVLCVGIDSLSVVNDVFTHAAGDVVLVSTAARIVAEVGEAESVARGAGVDFIILVTTGPNGRDPETLAEAIRHAAHESIELGGHRIEPTVSIGIASADLVVDPEHLIRAATLAMRTAKELGRDRVAFANPAHARAAEERLSLQSEVVAGLAAGEFIAWFQPVVDLADGTVSGYEALARWVRADGSVVEPAGFMSVLENTPLISQLDRIALEQSIARLAELPTDQFISFNVSARALSLDAYAAFLLERVAASGLDPTRLHAEVTETALFDASEAVVARMQRIADAGVQWYVDDFGTGYSSISHLRDLPVSGLKLDLSFTRGIAAGDSRCVQLARALAGMAEGLALETVAEGIEGLTESEVLRQQGWRYGQGWLFGKAAPGPVDERPS